MAECASCHKDTAPLLAFSNYAGVRTCTVTDSDGSKRQSLEPVFQGYRELCYPCYKSAVRADLARARSERR